MDKETTCDDTNPTLPRHGRLLEREDGDFSSVEIAIPVAAESMAEAQDTW